MIKNTWTAIVLSVFAFVLGAIILFGPSLGLSEAFIKWLVGGEALVGWGLLASMRGMFDDSKCVALLAAAAMFIVSGCGAQWYTPHVAFVTAAQETRVAARPLILELSETAMRDAARRVHDAGGDQPAAQAAAQAEGARWTCAIDMHSVFGDAVSLYTETLHLAVSADVEPWSIATGLNLARPIVDAWRAIASCAGTLEVPNFLRFLLPAWGL